MSKIKHFLLPSLLAVATLSGCFGGGGDSLPIRGDYPVSQSTSHTDGLEQFEATYQKWRRINKEAYEIFKSKQPVDAARFVEARETLKALHAEAAALPLSQCLNASRVSLLRAFSYVDKRIGSYQLIADVAKDQRSSDVDMLSAIDYPVSGTKFFCIELEKEGYKKLPAAIGDSSENAISNFPIDDSNAPITGMHKFKAMKDDLTGKIRADITALPRLDKNGISEQLASIKQRLADLKTAFETTPFSSCLNEARPFMLAAIDEAATSADEIAAKASAGTNFDQWKELYDSDRFANAAEAYRSLCYRAGKNGMRMD